MFVTRRFVALTTAVARRCNNQPRLYDAHAALHFSSDACWQRVQYSSTRMAARLGSIFDTKNAKWTDVQSIYADNPEKCDDVGLMTEYSQIKGKSFNNHGLTKFDLESNESDSDNLETKSIFLHNFGEVIFNHEYEERNYSKQLIRSNELLRLLETFYIDEDGNFCDENGFIIGSKNNEKTKSEFVYKRENMFRVSQNDLEFQRCKIIKYNDEPNNDNNSEIDHDVFVCKDLPQLAPILANMGMYFAIIVNKQIHQVTHFKLK